jgi:hypothetical protein
MLPTRDCSVHGRPSGASLWLELPSVLLCRRISLEAFSGIELHILDLNLARLCHLLLPCRLVVAKVAAYLEVIGNQLLRNHSISRGMTLNNEAAYDLTRGHHSESD